MCLNKKQIGSIEFCLRHFKYVRSVLIFLACYLEIQYQILDKSFLCSFISIYTYIGLYVIHDSWVYSSYNRLHRGDGMLMFGSAVDSCRTTSLALQLYIMYTCKNIALIKKLVVVRLLWCVRGHFRDRCELYFSVSVLASDAPPLAETDISPQKEVGLTAIRRYNALRKCMQMYLSILLLKLDNRCDCSLIHPVPIQLNVLFTNTAYRNS